MDIEKDDGMDVDAADAHADLHERRRLDALEDAARARAAAMVLPPSAFVAPNPMQTPAQAQQEPKEEPFWMKVLRSMMQEGMSESEARAKLAAMRISTDG